MNRIDLGTHPHYSRRNAGMSAISIGAFVFALAYVVCAVAKKGWL